MKTKEQVEEAIMNSLDWLEIPLGSYTVKIVDDGFYREVELIKWENVWHAGFVFPRSSISKKDIMLTNAVGVVDSGYRGEVMAKFRMAIEVGQIKTESEEHIFARPQFSKHEIYEVGERIGQLVIMPIPDIELEETEELSTTTEVLEDMGQREYNS